MSSRIFESVSDLPGVFPVFPLAGTLLFPRSILPLNIFEPRYLNMIDDAMAGDAVIGMIQSLGEGPKSHPDIAGVGCLGRISSYSETEDGRYLIALEGVCRFSVAQELPFEKPYREVEASWSHYAHDLEPAEDAGSASRERLLTALTDYLARNRLQADWNAAENAPMEGLVNSLCAACPFSLMEKQALLESVDLAARSEALITLLEMDIKGQGGSATWLQ